MKNLQISLSTPDPDCRLQPVKAVPLGRPIEGSIRVRPEHRFQEWIGLGGSFTEASAIALSRMSGPRQEEALRACFSNRSGHAYNLGRIHINSCDFSTGDWDYVAPGDATLQTFTLERDENLLFPLVRRAEQVLGARIPLVASPWSPPAWMKSNGDMKHGGTLLPEWEKTWADYLTRYIQEAQKRGLWIWGLTPQNEPQAVQVWESCIYSGEEQGRFVREHLGPALTRAGLELLRLIIWDHNLDELNGFCAPILDDPEAAKYIWGAGCHWYSGDTFEELETFHSRYPDKALLFTEGCMEGGVQLGSWEPAKRYIHHLIGYAQNWTCRWIDWNLFLDESGGPNHVGNLCDAPLILDGNTDRIHFQSSYHALGHFARFVPGGSVRVGWEASGDCPIEGTAFLRPDGRRVVILFNPADRDARLSLHEESASVSVCLPAESILTAVWDSPRP